MSSTPATAKTECPYEEDSSCKSDLRTTPTTYPATSTMSTTSDDDPATEPQFTLFPKLCPELRHEIIQFALYQPRVVEISFARNSTPKHLHTGIPALFHVSRETRHQAIKVFRAKGKKKKDGSLELRSQMLINYDSDTILISHEKRMHDLLGPEIWERIQSVAIHESWWYHERIRSRTFPKFGYRIDTSPGFCKNLKEFVVLSIPRIMWSQEPAESDPDLYGKQAEFVFGPPLNRRIWAKEFREKEEVGDLREHMEQLAKNKFNTFDHLRKSQLWASLKEDVESGWKGASNFRDHKAATNVKGLRGLVDEKNVWGGKMVFVKEA